MILDHARAVIFDLDGTLMDSMWLWKDIDIEYLGRNGHELPDDLQNKIEGMSFTETAQYFKERFSLSDSVEAIKQSWNEMAYEKYSAEVRLKPGAGDFLRELKRRRLPVGIASSNSRELITACLRANGVMDYFDCIAISCDVARGKPAPDIYLKVADSLDTAPADCLVFEDIPMGILAGLNAGMTVCAVEDAFSAAQRDVIRSLAHYYIKSYKEILENTYEVLNDSTPDAGRRFAV